MNQYVNSRNYFRNNISAGIEAVKKEFDFTISCQIVEINHSVQAWTTAKYLLISSEKPKLFKATARFCRYLHAFIYDAVVLDYLAGKDPKCELITVGKWSSMTGYGKSLAVSQLTSAGKIYCVKYYLLTLRFY